MAKKSFRKSSAKVWGGDFRKWYQTTFQNINTFFKSLQENHIQHMWYGAYTTSEHDAFM